MASVPLQTSWQIQRTAGEPTAIIRVRNLQSIIQGPQDAWGRQGRPQPILVSAEVSLHEPFGSSSSKDAVAGDTVHYGLLSKAILATLGRLDAEDQHSLSLHSLLNHIWMDLVGFDFTGRIGNLNEKKPFLNISVVRALNISLELPKASLLGSGVSLSGTIVYENEQFGTFAKARAMSVNLKGLRIPTLIGVNDNERQAKQVVVANISIEKYEDVNDGYAPLEEAVTNLVKDSTYETLEALASDLSHKIIGYLTSCPRDYVPIYGWHIRIGLEKPTAVALADAACVELRVNTADKDLTE
ncbi:Fc.00g065570.m01.CDS01 [Cosmosporella sp. VM-42]